LQGCHRVPPQILKKRKRNLRKDSACQRTEVKGAVPINGIGMSQAPRSRTAKPRGSSGVQSVATVPRLRESAAVLCRFRCSRRRILLRSFAACRSILELRFCSRRRREFVSLQGFVRLRSWFGEWIVWDFELQPGFYFGGLDLELCVSVLSQRWTVFVEIRGVSVFVRTFLAFGTSTASWPRNEKRHSKNMTVNARTKLST